MKIGDIITGDAASGLKFSGDFKGQIVSGFPNFRMRVLSGKYIYPTGFGGTEVGKVSGILNPRYFKLVETKHQKTGKMKTAYHTFEFRGRKITTSAVQQGNTVSVGYAVCMPEDTFKDNLSRTISKGRALSKSRLESYNMDPKLQDNYGVLKAIAVSWEHAIRENPSIVIKGFKK